MLYLPSDVGSASGPETGCLSRTRLFPLVVNHLACIYTIALMAISHYCTVHKIRSRTVDLLQLKDMAFQEIKNALVDGSCGVADQLISTVTIMAAYERVFGNQAICQTHIQGLTRMIALRGGLSTPGIDGLLEQTISWIGSNDCYIIGSRLYFDTRVFPTSTSGVVKPQPEVTNAAVEASFDDALTC